ncbi:MAG: GDP-mannose 4,6-dehydratase [bacterium]|nr:GDP-mannose 4,6-dehydratase [bacterium]
MKKVLITGVNGFVGMHLARELISRQYEVWGMSREKIIHSDDNIQLVAADLTDKQSLYNAFVQVQPDAVFHLAAQSRPGLSFSDPEKTFQINTIGTLHILDILGGLYSQTYKPRIMIVGSAEEYGNVAIGNLPVVESTPLNPNNPYSISKAAGYFLSMQYHKSYGLDIIYLSPFSHTGPEQKEGFLIPDVCKQIVAIEQGKSQPILVTGDLSSEKDYSDVRDIAKGYAQLMYEGVGGERYNLCSGKSLKVLDIVAQLVATSTVQIQHQVDPKKFRPAEVTVMRGSYDKIHKTTGWTPEISLEQTLKDSLDWWRANG